MLQFRIAGAPVQCGLVASFRSRSLALSFLQHRRPRSSTRTVAAALQASEACGRASLARSIQDTQEGRARLSSILVIVISAHHFSGRWIDEMGLTARQACHRLMDPALIRRGGVIGDPALHI